MTITARLIAALFVPLAFATAADAKKTDNNAPAVKSVRVGGHTGMRIDQVLSRRVMKEDVAAMVNVFATRKETHAWQTEFWGKWAIGACEYYTYTKNRQLYDMIEKSVEGIISHQDKDGYIGNYAPQAELAEWDIWGRKYVTLGLLAWHDISRDRKALKAACRQVDRLFQQLSERGISIVETGNYRGMPSGSILNAIVKLYKATGNKKYLAIAESIAADLESGKGPRIIAKTLQGIPVAKRFKPAPGWYNPENGQKAYEMMSCLQGMADLYLVNGNRKLFDGVVKAVDMIVAQETNIAGSGAAAECWYGGADLQTRPAVHEMETCVTTTWIGTLRRMLAVTGEARYADLMERTIYNSLLAAIKDDASQIDKYTPLEGARTVGEKQCGMNMNCCNANGPRGLVAIPQNLYAVKQNTPDGMPRVCVNLYMPSNAEIALGGKKAPAITLVQEGDYPATDNMSIKVGTSASAKFTISLRIPEWSGAATQVDIADRAGNTVATAKAVKAGWHDISREWSDGDVVRIKFHMPARLTRLNGCIAITRGPIVLARDSRFGDGDIDEVVGFADKNGAVEVKAVKAPDWAWMAFAIPATLGVDYIDHGKPVEIKLCDFSSAGNTWNRAERYRVWLPEVFNAEKAEW